MFDKKLFFEGLRRILVWGIVTAIILFTVTAFVPILSGGKDDVRVYGYSTVEASEFSTDTKVPFEALGENRLAAPMYGLMIFSVIMLYAIFGFLFERRACDLYHAMPQKRYRVFVSFYLAWLCWVAVIAVVGVLISSILWGTIHDVTVSAALFFSETGKIFLSSVFCSSFALISIMIAGNTGTSLILALSLFVLAPLLGNLLVTVLDYIPFFNIYQPVTEYLTIGHYLPLSVLQSDSIFVSENHYWWMYIADIVLILLMTVLAGFLYCRRKSEYAGDASPSAFIAIFIRTVFAAIPMCVVGFELIKKSEGGYTNTETAIVFVTVAVLIWFIYELITTKSIKKMLKAVKTVWILPAIVLVLFGVYYSIRSVTYITRFEASDVKSVKVDIQHTDISMYEYLVYFYDNDDFCEFVTLTDDADIANITDLYNRTLSMDYNIKERNRRAAIYVIFELRDGRRLYRRLSPDGTRTYIDAAKKMLDSIDRNSEYRKIATELNYNYNDVSIESNGGKYFDYEDRCKVLASFISEYDKLTVDERYEFKKYSSSTTSEAGSFFLRLLYRNYRGNMALDNCIFIVNDRFTPETYELVKSLCVENAAYDEFTKTGYDSAKEVYDRIIDSMEYSYSTDNFIHSMTLYISIEEGRISRTFRIRSQDIETDFIKVYKLLAKAKEYSGEESDKKIFAVTLTQTVEYVCDTEVGFSPTPLDYVPENSELISGKRYTTYHVALNEDEYADLCGIISRLYSE